MWLRTVVACGVAVAASLSDRLPAATSAEASVRDRGPADLALVFTSPFDGSTQTYRLYLPSAYDGQREFPLLVALHGTSGDHNTYFDSPGYRDGIYQREAEKRGIVVLCPNGRDALSRPTEWRGVGEVHVLAAIEDVIRRFRIDRDRIVCTGQSMGGTGTTYLCSRYPDVFAGGAPLASTYGHVSLVANLRHVPMLYVQGADDWPVYANDGPIPLTREMARLGYTQELWMIPGAGHNTMNVSTERVLDWASQQRLVRHPRHVTFRAYLPLHGRAYWTEIQAIERLGWFAEIDARIEQDNRIVVKLTNATQAVLRPEPEMLSLQDPLQVVVNDRVVFLDTCREDQEIRLRRDGQAWAATLGPREVRSRTAYGQYPIGSVVDALDWEGAGETTLGSWLADVFRDASGADIALVNRGHYRGIPIQAGQTLGLIDLINWLRPSDRVIAVFRMRGADLLEIIEDNIRDDPKERRFLLQVSGCHYRFDRRRPFGQRIVDSNIDPQREYSVACSSHSLTRTDTLHLAGRYGRIPFTLLETTTLSAAWRYLAAHEGKLLAPTPGRLQGN